MFDIAYEADVCIEVSKKIKEKLSKIVVEKLRNKALYFDSFIPFSGLEDMIAIERLNSIIHFYEFILYTHGGI